MSPAKLTPKARRDLAELGRWILKENPQAAAAFREVVGASLTTIGENPLIGTSRPDLTSWDVRFYHLRRFPVFWVYDTILSEPRVIRVLHTSRDLQELLG